VHDPAREAVEQYVHEGEGAGDVSGGDEDKMGHVLMGSSGDEVGNALQK
jgi:hypothetical protein